MRWLVVRFRGRDKTPSIIDWDRQQRPSHRASDIESSAPITATASPRQATGRQAAHTGSGKRRARQRQGRRKAVQRAGSAGLRPSPAHRLPRAAIWRGIRHGPTRTSLVVFCRGGSNSAQQTVAQRRSSRSGLQRSDAAVQGRSRQGDQGALGVADLSASVTIHHDVTVSH